MKSGTFALLFCAVICAVYGIYKYVRILIDKKGTCVAKATIISVKEVLITTEAADGERIKSGFYAKVSYNAKGRKMTPKTLYRLKESKKVGDTVEIRYFKDHPEDIYQESFFVPLVAGAAAVFVALMGLIFQFAVFDM